MEIEKNKQEILKDKEKFISQITKIDKTEIKNSVTKKESKKLTLKEKLLRVLGYGRK